MEKEYKVNLQKEGSRRKQAEYQASQLKKKVNELQFLLDEKLGEDDEESSEIPPTSLLSMDPPATIILSQTIGVAQRPAVLA